MSIKKELEEGRYWLGRIRDVVGNSCDIEFIFGNHSWRWEKFILDKSRELHDLDNLSLEAQLHFDKYNINSTNYHGREQYYQWGRLLIGHFNKVNKHSGYTAKNLLEDKSISLIQGHTHRMGMSAKRLFDRTIVAYENGCLCNLHPDYVKVPNWQQGFSIVHKHKKSDHFQVQQLFIVHGSHDGKYRTFYGDKAYTA